MKKKGLIEDWVDRDEIRSLAEQLFTRPPDPVADPEEMVYGDDFEGFADPPAPSATPVSETPPELPPAPSLKARPEPASPRAEPREEKKERVAKEEAPLGQPNPFRKKERAPSPEGREGDKKEQVVGRPSPFHPRSQAEAPSSDKGSADNRSLRDFVTWLGGQIPLEACLVARDGGEILYSDFEDERLRRVAGLLAGASHRKEQRGGLPPSAMVVRVASGGILQVIPVALDSRRYYTGLLLPRPLADGGVKAFSKALRKALA